MPIASKRIMFSGYAPVHFLSFLPVLRRLEATPGIEVWLSGGYRHKDADGNVRFESAGFYDRFDVDRQRVLSVEQTRHEDFDVVVCAHLSDALFPRSTRRTVQIFHGVSFKNYAVRGKALRFDYLCLPGVYHAARYRELGLVRPGGAQIFVTGFAKVDRLVAGGLQRRHLLQDLVLDPAKPTLLYAPTGDRANSLEIMGEQVIEALAAHGGWNLLIKPHDHPKEKIDWFARLARFESASVRLVRDLDIVPYLHAADLLLSDASSTITEFTLLDRPIVLLDVPKLLERVVERGGALDVENYGHRLGPVVADAAAVPSVVEAALRDSSAYAAVRRRVAREVFHRPGSATERVATVVRFAAGLVDEMPADIERLLPEQPQAITPDPVGTQRSPS